MPIKMTGLTKSQADALAQVVATKTTDFVVSTEKTTAVLNGNAEQAGATIQGIADEIRETKGGRSAEYRSLVALRNKLETGGDDIVILPNGANVSGNVPPVLAGVPVVKDEATPKGKRAAKVAPDSIKAAMGGIGKVAKTAGAALNGKTSAATNEDMPIRDPEIARANWAYQRKNAPTDAAADYWGRKLDSLPVPVS